MLRKAVILSALITAVTSQLAIAAPSNEDFNKSYKKFQQLSQKGQWKQSEPHARKAYDIGLALFGDSSPNTAALAHNYGVALLKLKKRDKAKEVLEQAVKLHENAYGNDSEKLVPVLLDLSSAMYRGSDAKTKNSVLERVLDLTETAHGKGSAHWGQRSVEVGVKMLGKSTLKQSRTFIKQGHEALSNHLGEDAIRVHYAALQLGKVELALGHTKDAISLLTSVVDGTSNGQKGARKLELAARELLVQSLERLGKRDEATEHLQSLAKARAGGEKISSAAVVKATPKMPSTEAAKKGGKVTVSFDVDEKGFVINAKVTKRDGSEALEKASLEAVNKFRYVPKFKDGEFKVTKNLKNEFTFKAKK